MSHVKEININNCTYYFFDDMINIKNFDPNWIKIDKKSHIFKKTKSITQKFF